MKRRVKKETIILGKHRTEFLYLFLTYHSYNPKITNLAVFVKMHKPHNKPL